MRLPDWQLRLAEFGQARASMPFRWGSNDCCSFAAAAVEAITGENPMAAADRYDSEFGALRLIAAAGGLRALVSSFLGDEIRPAAAAVGDIVLVLNDGAELVGVCNGVNVMAPSAGGMVALSMDAAVAAWRI
ncbi:hypothetical protein [Variovorax sp. OV084]|jgi:hypothetical protein|uniref:DUF6950 family protein n=1 Tax=Variovorax sp. OV084 TaxID=1882777 RepID=UPI0008C0C985|nr:hypothetical protein [Variovorax sp. OV084]SES76280.1 hypothetical protein SAMN05443580_101202 [Variovorax sp. OV084]